MEFSYTDIAKMLDHSLLVPTMTTDVLEAGIDLALAYDVASVCIMPYYLRRCAERLAGSTVQASTTIGFPHGGHTTEMKKAEAAMAIEQGCQELDMVVNVSQVLSENWQYVSDDIAAVAELAHAAGRKIKVIFENCYLEDSHKIQLCKIATELGADWVKTSTGYGTSGATVEDLKLMRENCPSSVQVKAAGGVRDLDMILTVRALGVSRIGASKTQGMLDECRERLGMEPIVFAGPSTAGGY